MRSLRKTVIHTQEAEGGRAGAQLPFSFKNVTFIIIYFFGSRHRHATVAFWRTEDSLCEQALPFYNLRARD